MRADARRNRQRILQAAEEVFARDGIAVPVDTVAERAAVGVGTLYRHFPTKEALFEAIVEQRLGDLVAAADDDGGDATEAFFAFLDRVGEQVALKHDLFDALAQSGIDIKARCAGQLDELKARLGTLHQGAVACGGVRGDVTAAEVMDLVVGACHRPDGSNAPADCAKRLLRVVCDGLRTLAD